MSVFDPYAAYQAMPQAAAANGAWPAANRAIYVPFSLARHRIAQIMWLQNGTVAGNLDMGIYDEAGTRLVSSGSTAQAGASTIQIVDITDTLLTPGSYFMALAMDGTTGQTGRYNPSTQFLRCAGVQEQASAFVLPATFTLANPSSAYIPIMGVGFASTI